MEEETKLYLNGAYATIVYGENVLKVFTDKGDYVGDLIISDKIKTLSTPKGKTIAIRENNGWRGQNED